MVPVGLLSTTPETKCLDGGPVLEPPAQLGRTLATTIPIAFWHGRTIWLQLVKQLLKAVVCAKGCEVGITGEPAGVGRNLQKPVLSCFVQ